MNGGSAERKESARNILFFLVGIYHQKKRGFGIRNGRKERRMKDDLISRQAAIDALNEEYHGMISDESMKIYKIIEWLGDLPSAQPEQLNDDEQRIFLSAMAREEQICKNVDDQWKDYGVVYEDSLVRTCHEITRKVKGALWT